MQLERNTFMHLKQYLLDHSYPENSIAVEYPISRNCIVDIAIIDRELNIPIQLFEIKSYKNSSMVKAGIEQLKRDLSFLKNKDIPCYLVFPKSNAPFFDVERVFLNNSTSISPIMDKKNIDEIIIPDYNAQLISRIVGIKEEIKKKKDRTLDWFRWICWIMAVLIFVIGILYLFRIFVFDVYLSFLLALVVALVIIPFVESVKILGVEFRRIEKRVDEIR